MTTTIRFNPRLLTTEDEAVQFFCFLNEGYVFIKRHTSVKIIPYFSASKDNSESAVYRICGSEIGGGHFLQVKSDVSRGIVLPLCKKDEAGQPADDVPLAFCMCIRKPSDRHTYTVGQFELVTTASSASKVVSSCATSAPKPASESAGAHSGAGSPHFKLQRRFQLKVSQTVLHISPFLSRPHTYEAEKVVVLVKTSVDKAPFITLGVHILSTMSLDDLVTPVTLPLAPDTSQEAVWRVVTLPTTDRRYELLAIWGGVAQDTGNAVVGFPAPSAGLRLASIQPVLQNTTPSFVSWPSMILAWDWGIYSCFALNVDTSSKHQILDTQILRTFDTALRSKKDSAKNRSFVTSLLPSQFLETNWNHKEGCLSFRVRHFVDGVSFVSGLDDHDGDGKENCVALPLPEAPSFLNACSTDRISALLIATKNQIYTYSFRRLENYTSAVLASSEGDAIATNLPSAAVLKQLGCPNVDLVRQAFDFAVHHDVRLAHVPSDVEAFETHFKWLVQCGLLRVTVAVVDRLLEYDFQACCRYLIHSPLVSETVIVRLLERNPDLFLLEFITYTSFTSPRWVPEIRQQLGSQQLKVILDRLEVWCSILTGLPAVLTEQSGLPPLYKVVDFISVLIDAKFREWANVQNPALIDCIRKITASLANNLVVKKNIQKLLGQLHSIETATMDFLPDDRVDSSRPMCAINTFKRLCCNTVTKEAGNDTSQNLCTRRTKAPASVAHMSAVYDRFNIHAQLEHLQSKYQGTGNADVTKWQWSVNIHRDTLASTVGHYSRMAYITTAENVPMARLRYELLQSMIRPCGPPVPSPSDIDVEN